MAIADRSSLDRAEGAGFGYDRADAFSVVLDNGETVAATTYVATGIDSSLQPYDWYLALVLAGTRIHALGEAHLNWLRTVPYTVDPEMEREARLDALKALEAEGIADLNLLWSH